MKRFLFCSTVYLLLLAGGCRVYRYQEYRATTVTSSGHATVVWTDVRTSIWWEYYGCDEGTVVYLNSCHDIDDSDLFFLLFVARHSHVPVQEVVEIYLSSGRVLFPILSHYHLSYDILFLDLPNGVHCPPPYGRAYGYYWNRHRKPRYTLSNEECRALLELQIAHHYYGYSYAEYFVRFEEVQRTERHPFFHIAVNDVHRIGPGARDFRGEPARQREKTWQQPKEERREKKEERKEEKQEKNNEKQEERQKEKREERHEEKREERHEEKRDERKKEEMREHRQEEKSKERREEKKETKKEESKEEKKDNQKEHDSKEEGKEKDKDKDKENPGKGRKKD